MNKEMLGKIMRHATYQLKEGTKTSYIDASAQGPLPRLVSISVGVELSHVVRTGRGALPKVGQMKATFTRAEASPYKRYKPYKVQTSIWRVQGTCSYYYGSLGISNARGKIVGDNGDMLVLYTADWKRVEVYIFAGLAEPMRLPQHLAEAVDYLQGKPVR